MLSAARPLCGSRQRRSRSGRSAMSSAAAPAAPAGAAGWAPSSGQAVNTSALSPEATTSLVQKYYGETLTRTEDLATGACLCAAAPPPRVRALLARLPRPVVERFYGCGSPLPAGCEGLRVVDLGCGSGRDAYVAAALVGPSGSVLGVDFTPQQLAVANAHVAEWTAELGYAAPNLRFVEGRVEDLAAAGVPPASVDVAISNCVVNLSPDKGAVLRSVWDSLAQGGELHFADVYCDRRLPSALRSDPLLVGECLGGALYVEDFRRLAAEVGFVDARVLASAAVPLLDERVVAKVGAARFTSITFRLFKLPGRLETLCEDYGQVAVYKGTIPGCEAVYDLDDHHRLEKSKPLLVCGNTASMLSETWLAPHFSVVGNRDTHFGLFPCGPASAVAAAGPGAACC